MHLDRIDWSRPWFAPFRPAAAQIIDVPDWRQALNQAATTRALQNHKGLPIQFVSQADLPSGVAYESFISDTGGVPTRDNLHDFFNALAWLTYPKTKARLNALQATEIARAISAKTFVSSSSSIRGKLRDAATIFDENAALLIIRDKELLEALREHRWAEAFLHRRKAFEQDCEVWIFGHALLEKLVSPYKSITAHTWVVTESRLLALPAHQKCQEIDALVADQLSASLGMTRFTPLPLLGIPNWWSQQDADFYEDTSVFRPKRHARS